MISVRIWNLESDHDTKAVRFLENEFVKSRKLRHLAIQTTGRSALRKCHRKGAPLRESLRRAIQLYLAQDDYIIFLEDPDQQRDQKSSPLAEQLRCVVKDYNFSDKVFFAPDIPESESFVPQQWENLISGFHTEVEEDRKRFKGEWDKTLAHFHDAFADTPEEEVIRDFEEALAEVRRERT